MTGDGEMFFRDAIDRLQAAIEKQADALREHVRECNTRYQQLKDDGERKFEAIRADGEARRREQNDAYLEVRRQIDRMNEKVEDGFKHVSSSLQLLHEKNERMAEKQSKDRSAAQWFVISVAGAMLVGCFGIIWYLLTHPTPNIILQ